jgi:hypothetical protein
MGVKMEARMVAARPLSSLVAGAVALVGLATARAQTSAPGVPAPPPAVAAAPPAPPDGGIGLRLAVPFEVANGIVTGSFHNQLLGLRLDGRFSEHLSLGGYVGAGDLKGKDGRATSALVMAVLEYMAGDPAATVRYPVRFGTGYLAANGPVVRASGGLAIAVSKRTDLVGELASMIWVTNNQNLLSLDFALELAFRL